ncbi:chorismate lyase [Thalassotalea sp. M1531]|uniref:Probable chorismate pyruvate-lyase n=1 Tax=Thalassotalea algicola TaxID=2716224 RepID=A0A7Y0Q848_9GAMM|nr:chorismate lyase [Thalassotalea algicola]NMP33078.1 chorismate lyase [Thalassotalea algicola]
MLDFSHHFPITLAAKWQHEVEEYLPPELHSWLYDAQSLTARLKAHCKEFKVVVIGQEQQLCIEQDACDHIPVGEPVIVREVLLYCDDVPQVFARSLMPLATLTGDEAFLSDLGTKPLGQVIFNSPFLKRGDFSVAKFDAQSSVAALANALTLPASDVLWGRRSIFFLHDKPLAVAEVFLPHAFAYQTEGGTA